MDFKILNSDVEKEISGSFIFLNTMKFIFLISNFQEIFALWIRYIDIICIDQGIRLWSRLSCEFVKQKTN